MSLTKVQGGMIGDSPTLITPIVATTMGVGNITPASTGAGVSYPATQSPSTDANTLDDYEEGIWTPIDASGAGLTLVASGGRYVKIGRLVQFWFRAQYPTTSNATIASIGGLPYTGQAGGAGSLDVSGGWNSFFSQNYSSMLTGYVPNGSTTLSIYNYNSGNALTNANVSTFNIYAFGSYYASA